MKCALALSTDGESDGMTLWQGLWAVRLGGPGVELHQSHCWTADAR